MDMVLWGHNGGIEMWRHDPNMNYVLGLAPAPKKIRYPAYMGAGLVPMKKLRAWLAGSWHTEVQRTVDPGRMQAGVLRPVAELLLKGYPVQMVKKAAAGVQSPGVRHARIFASRGMRAMAGRYGQQIDKEAIHNEVMDMHKITGALRHLGESSTLSI